MGPGPTRVVAMQTLYEHDAAKHPAGSVFERLRDEAALTAEDAEMARRLVEGVLARLGEIDAEIARAAPTWPVTQLPGVDRAILRLAIFEALHDNCPASGRATTEVRALAQAYGSDSSSKFVGGVLSAVLAREADRPRPRAT